MNDATEQTTELTVWRVRGAGAFGLLLVAFGCGTDNGGASGPMTASMGGTSATMGGAQGKSGGTKGMTGGKANSSSGGASSNSAAGGKASSSGGTGTGGDTPAIGGATGSGGKATGTGGGQSNPVGTRSAGCGKTETTMSGYVDATVEGKGRRYYLSFPANYDPNKAYALVFGFHGGGDISDAGENFRQWSGVEDNSNSEAIFAYIDGVGGIWDLNNEGNDSKMVDAIFNAVRSDFCIDETDVFAFGFSYGGWAATQIACARPALIRGIVSIAGGGPMESCNQAVAAMIVHGTMDDAEKISSGEATRDKFKANDGCGDTESAAAPSPCVTYPSCSKPLLWCQHDGGHGIPAFTQQGTWTFFAGLR